MRSVVDTQEDSKLRQTHPKKVSMRSQKKRKKWEEIGNAVLKCICPSKKI